MKKSLICIFLIGTLAVNNLCLAKTKTASVEDNLKKLESTTETNLKGMNFKGVDLKDKKYNVVNKNLDETNFNNADCKEKVFSKTISMKATKFQSADCRGADFSKVTATGAYFDKAKKGEPTNLTNADFSDANLKNSTFKGAICKGAKFSGANLTKTKFQKADLSGATFDEKTMFYTKRTEGKKGKITYSDKAEVKDAIFTGAKGLTVEQKEFLTKGKALIEVDAPKDTPKEDAAS